MKGLFTLTLLFTLLFTGCSDKNGTADNPSSERKGETERRMKAQREFLEKERESIEAYMKDRKLRMKRSGTGLYYKIIRDSAAGPKASVGDVVKFNYDISLLSGRSIYNSANTGPRELMIDREDAEIGVHEALKLLGLGDKGLFILPSHLAFGVAGDQVEVPPKTPLAYEIEVLEIESQESR